MQADSAGKLSVRFVNRAGVPLTIYWDGEANGHPLTPMGSTPVNGMSAFVTYVGHRWVAKRTDTEKTVCGRVFTIALLIFRVQLASFVIKDGQAEYIVQAEAHSEL